MKYIPIDVPANFCDFRARGRPETPHPAPAGEELQGRPGAACLGYSSVSDEAAGTP